MDFGISGFDRDYINSKGFDGKIIESKETKVTDWANYYHPNLNCEKSTWDLIIKKMADSSMNMAIEETCEHQQTYRYSVIRSMDLWWHDFLFLVEQVERMNVRS